METTVCNIRTLLMIWWCFQTAYFYCYPCFYPCKKLWPIGSLLHVLQESVLSHIVRASVIMKLLALALWEHVLVILWWVPGTFILLQSQHRHNQSCRTCAWRYSSSKATHDLHVWLTSMWWVKLCLQMQELMKSSSPKNYGVVWSLYLPSEYSIFSNHRTLQGWSKSIEEITLYLDGWIYMGTGQWGSISFKLLTAGCQNMNFLLRSLFRQLMLFLSLPQKSNPANQNNVEITLESFTSSQSYVYHR